MNVFVVLIVFISICIIYGVLLEKYGLRGLTCNRSFSRKAVTEGEEAELVEVIVNDRPMLVPWLRVESRVSRYLRFGRQDNFDISGDMYHKSLFTLMPFQRITRRHKVKFLRRGTYNIGSASLTAGDLSGLFQCSRDQRLDVEIMVYPKLLDDRDMPVPLSRLIGESMIERQLQRDPFLINSIRPYRPGDPVRDIHWPATARTGEVHVRVHDYSAQTRLMVIINAQIRENQWDNLMDYEQDVVEKEISMAATLCLRTLRMGLTAGFATNMPVGESEEGVVMMPSGGAAREEELLAAFARLRVLRTLRFPTFLDSLMVYSGLDMVVLSCYDSPEIQEKLEALRRRGNTVKLFVLESEVRREAE